MFKVRAVCSFTDLLKNKERKKGEVFDVETVERYRALIGENKDKRRYVELISSSKPKEYKRKGPKVIIYQSYLYHIGGIETFLYNFSKHYKDRNIELVVKLCEVEPLTELSKYCDITVDAPGNKYECNSLILGNYNCDDIIDKFNAKRIYQMIHADWEGIKKIPQWANFKWRKHQKIDKIICVSDTAAKGLKKTMGYDSEVIYNCLEDEPLDEELKVFITLSRATNEKGIGRIVKMAEEFKRQGKKFIWFLCCSLDQAPVDIRRKIRSIPEFIVLKGNPAYKQLIKNCDYLVQLSDTESFCYSAYEALQRGVPIILSDFPEAFNIVDDGENGFIIKRDLSNLDVNKIFNHKPKNNYYVDRCDYEKWEKVFNGDL